MDVERTREEILDYLSGAMGEARRVEFETRLGEDPRLASFVRQHLRVDGILDALPDADPSAERLSHMAETILRPDARRPSTAPRIERTAKLLGFPRRKFAVAAAAAVLVGVGLYAWSAFGPPADLRDGVTEAAAPDFFADPVFIEDFEVIQNMQVLQEFGDALTLPDDEALLDVVTLQVLSGA